MTQLRALILDYRKIALLLIVAALALKAVIPAGYMVDQNAKVFTVTVCNGELGPVKVQHIVIPAKKGEHEPSQHDGKAMACPYSALAMASIGGADPLLLALALVFILQLGFNSASQPLPARLVHLRPPLRGPPAI